MDTKKTPRLCESDALVLATHLRKRQPESRQLKTKRSQRRLRMKGLLDVDGSGRYYPTSEAGVAMSQHLTDELKRRGIEVPL